MGGMAMSGDYLTRLLRAHALGDFQPGTVTVLTVAHDDDCTRPDGGPCTCRPDITADNGTRKTDIDDHGNAQGGAA